MYSQLSIVYYFFYLLLFTHSICTYSENTYSPYVDSSHPMNVYWGDTHVHTNLSLDAYNFGNKNLGPDHAYRFARGEVVTANNGMQVKLGRPLDFLVVADHASNMGVMQGLERGDPELLKTDIGKRWFQRLQEAKSIQDANKAQNLFYSMVFDGFVEDIVEGAPDFEGSVWEAVTATADQYNSPGKFTAFIGYEWTAEPNPPVIAMGIRPVDKIAHLHRVIIFKDDAKTANQIRPFSRYDSAAPEDLWSFLSTYELNTKGEAIAIPHNSNLSDGNMFAITDTGGSPFNPGYAKSRSRWEPLVETTQTKGDSETHPLLSPNDEFADYERTTWSKTSAEKKQYEYVRSALKLGLKQQNRLGVNPFKFGMIGSSDAHSSLSALDENNFWGGAEPSGKRIKGWSANAAGYAAIWAEDNTREALFAAMKRRETYATTGPRMTVRFFGGWDYQEKDAVSPDMAMLGYLKGVPMGGDLSNAPENMSPRFLIRAVRDPDGANLDRVQVIKGWHDSNGELFEKVYNVALSDGRKENWRGIVKPVGNTVDISTASYTNSIGDPELSVVWQDPDFNKDELAFYYARVLEIPTPRWTAYDAKFFSVEDVPDNAPMITQERAYTSPIWYSPPAKAGGE